MIAPAHKPLRVLQVIPQLHAGGAEEEAVLAAHAIQNAGGQAYVASQGGQLVNKLEESGAQHITLPLATKNPYRIWRHVSVLERIVKQHHITLLHVRSRAPAWSVMMCALKLNIPWVATYHSAYKDEGFFKHLYNSVMARADRVIVISRFIENIVHTRYQKHSWFKKEHVRLVSRGIDASSFSPNAMNLTDLLYLRQSLSLPENQPIILLPGRFCKRKGHSLLLQAFSQVLKTLPASCHPILLYVGQTSEQDPYTLSLTQEVKHLGLTQYVHFLPYTTDIRLFYALSDIVVIPSLKPEGFGRVTAEAAAFEKVVIASNHGATSEIIVSPDLGFLVEPQDSVSLETSLHQALSLPLDARYRMGQKARQHVLQNFSQSHFDQGTLSTYRELLSGTPL